MSRSVTIPTGFPFFVTIPAAIPFFCIDLAASTTVLASGRYKTFLDMYFVTGSSRESFGSIMSPKTFCSNSVKGLLVATAH